MVVAVSLSLEQIAKRPVPLTQAFPRKSDNGQHFDSLVNHRTVYFTVTVEPLNFSTLTTIEIIHTLQHVHYKLV